MYFYWRIMEELKYLGEVLVFHDPRFDREFRAWVRKNRAGLAHAEVEKKQIASDKLDLLGIQLSLN